MKNYRKHLPPPPVARVVIACVFTLSLFSCKITTSEPDTFTVAFDANGGSGSIESITKTENEEFDLPANIFTRIGYTFSGWNTKSTPDESSKSYKDKEKIKLTEDLTLFAQWEEIAKVFYTVKFDANGGTGEMNEITAESRIEIAITENSFTKAGWTFSGWNTKSDGTGASYNDKTKITLTADVTLYAQWAAGTGTAYKLEHWQQNIADDDYTLTKTEPMTGTTGEETAAKAEETVGFTAKEFAQAKIAADGSSVIKIYYDRKIITLTFDADNGENKTTLSGKFGAEIVSPTPEKTDFIFTGWSTEKRPTESSKVYKDKEEITLTEDLTLFAQWEENSYKINYELNGGTNAEENPATFKKDDNINLAEPTYEYFDFCGWYFTQDFSGEAITGWNTGEKTGDIMLYAKWTVKAENVVNAIKNLTEGTHNICVVGEIDETTVKNMGKALRSNENVKVNLDLSGTTRLESIPSHAFDGCTSLTNIELPESITTIDDFAFYGCSSLIDIKIPTSLTRIGRWTFGGCISLKNIEFPASVTSIGDNAFTNCKSFTDVKIPANLTDIGFYAFDGCRNVTSLYVENNNKGYQAFNNCLYTKYGKVLITVFGNPSNISFLQGITAIDAYACHGCTNLTYIKIPESVTTIYTEAFSECSNLKEIEIPANVTSIRQRAFYGCSNLTTVNYMGTIEQWNSIVYFGNKNLTSAKIICTDGIINE